jgi:uncharacterized LabA/DUF88 family protein
MAEISGFQRVGVLVDVSNLYHSARALYKGRVNFKNVLETVVAGRQLIRAIAYVISAAIPEEKVFFEALERAGFEVKAKDLQIFPGGIKKGDWDVGLAVDAVILAPKLDVLILATGDGDYVPLVSYLSKNRGVRVEVASFGRSTSGKLIEEADSFLDLDLDPQKFIIKSAKAR